MKALFVNPPVYDFSVYDLWLKPLGFLSLARLMDINGWDIEYFDFMDRQHPFYGKQGDEGRYGCGRFYEVLAEKHEIYSSVPRKYKRFGIPGEVFTDFCDSLEEPDFIFVTSGMTYWFPGVGEVVENCKKKFHKTPVILGGIYPSFCGAHAGRIGADFIFQGKDLQKFCLEFSKRFNVRVEYPDKLFPYWELYEKLSYLCVKTSEGCPFDCYYCGVKKLEPDYRAGDIGYIYEMVCGYIEKYGMKDIAFYDDALLFNFSSHIGKFLDRDFFGKNKVRFHAPNGLHPRFIENDTALVLKKANFKTLRLSLESTFPERARESSYKTTLKEFERAVRILVNAGFTKEEIGVYIIAGLPGQDIKEVESSVIFLRENFPCTIKIAEYSPIPGTAEYSIASEKYPELPIENPLYQNNSIFPLWTFDNKWEKIDNLKQLAKS